MLLGHGPEELVNLGGRGPAVQPRHLVEVGVCELMPTEHALIREYDIRVALSGELERRGVVPVLEEAIARLGDETDAFYLSVDIDAAAGEVFDACAAPMVGGMTAREMQVAVDLAVSAPGFLGMDLTEYCPGKDTSGKTFQLVTQVLHSAFGYGRWMREHA